MRALGYLIVATLSIAAVSAVSVVPRQLAFAGLSARQVGSGCELVLLANCAAELVAFSTPQNGDNCTAQLEVFGETGVFSDSCCSVATDAFSCYADAAAASTDCTDDETRGLEAARDIFNSACDKCTRLIDRECKDEVSALAAPINGVDCLSELVALATDSFAPVCCDVSRAYLSCGIAAGEEIPECTGKLVLPNFKAGLALLSAGPCSTSTPSPEPRGPGTPSPLPSASPEGPPSASPEGSPSASPEGSPSASPDGSPSASESPDGGDGDDGVCFPASATVKLEDGSLKSMHEVRIGDKVQTGPSSFSEVYFFSHRTTSGVFEFVRITTSSNATVSLTGNHYVRTGAGGLVAAKRVKAGDQVVLANGDMSDVTDVRAIVDSGLFNPHTLSGDLVVDGVATSTYTTTVHPALAQILLAPIRWAYVSGASALCSLDNGAGSLVGYIPNGPATA